MNKAENVAGVWIQGILGRGKNICTDPKVKTCLADWRTQNGQCCLQSRWSAGTGVLAVVSWQDRRLWSEGRRLEQSNNQSLGMGGWSGDRRKTLCLCVSHYYLYLPTLGLYVFSTCVPILQQRSVLSSDP